MRAMVARMLKGYSVFILAYYSRCYYIVENISELLLAMDNTHG
ncbi:hypothetical protein BANRA_01023 [Escherichia coli]|nr:hypothetical protein BANRA_01023 [Escherichia coli]